MLLHKWDYQVHDYMPHFIPEDWNCLIYSEDMNEIVNCPHCGKKLLWGNTYTSLEIHNNVGFGYGVCAECYEAEWKRREEAEGK